MKVNKIIGISIAIIVITSGMIIKTNATEDNYYNCLPLECENDNKVSYSNAIDTDLQRYINNLCARNRNITPELLYAIMSYESGYDKQHITAKRYFGLMQIDRQHFSMLQERTGLEVNEKTILYSYTNVRCGYELLNICMEYFKEKGYVGEQLIYISLSAYGRGIGYTEQALQDGEESNSYSDNVMAMYHYINDNKENFEVK